MTKINYKDTLEKGKISIPHDSKIDISKLTHPNDKYLCDIIAYGDKTAMDFYFNFYKMINKLTHIHGLCQETLLYHYLINKDEIYHH